MFRAIISFCVILLSHASSCRFAPSYKCIDFLENPAAVNEYIDNVMQWENKFASAGVGYNSKSGYTYDGFPLNYETGELYGTEHAFSAPSKESIHLSVLALAVNGDERALTFGGGKKKVLELLQIKIDGYNAFNAKYPGFGCYTTWVGFNETDGSIQPLPDWMDKLPGLDNGEWFWSIYAVVVALEKAGHVQLAGQYRLLMECQRNNAKTMFYRGNGDVSAVVSISDIYATPSSELYSHTDGSNYLDDPYEGELMTNLLYLFAPFDSEDEREQLWEKKRKMFQAVNYTIPAAESPSGAEIVVTVQKGFWFSAHEQWKLLLMPYLDDDLPMVQQVFRNAEVARTMDAYRSGLPGLLASINDVTDGAEEIPDYISPAGIAEISFQEVFRRDVITPYGAYGLMLVDKPKGLCWYNNMLSGPRMQGPYGSTEAINVNGTEISPLTTWDSKITTVLAMLGGVGDLVKHGLELENAAGEGSYVAYDKFVDVITREHERVFGVGELLGSSTPIQIPGESVPSDKLSDWELSC